jgi:hypothetical protein
MGNSNLSPGVNGAGVRSLSILLLASLRISDFTPSLLYMLSWPALEQHNISPLV